jgi:hypothetical protein
MPSPARTFASLKSMAAPSLSRFPFPAMFPSHHHEEEVDDRVITYIPYSDG